MQLMAQKIEFFFSRETSSVESVIIFHCEFWEYVCYIIGVLLQYNRTRIGSPGETKNHRLRTSK